MTENHKKQFGIWMDSQHAIIVGRKNIESGEFVVLGHVKSEPLAGNSNENTANNAERTLLHKFFKDISTHLQNVEELHITGTGTAQEQFKKFLAETPQFKKATVNESTANKMSDEKLIEFISQKFH